MTVGWHSGRACLADVEAAAAEKCAMLTLVAGSNADYVRCRSIDPSGCGAAVVGGLCDAPMVVQRQSITSSTANATGGLQSQFASLIGCELQSESPFVMSVADGATLSFLIVGVWAVAFYWRSLVKAVWSSDAEST